MRANVLAPVVAGALLSLAGNAWAATKTASFTVSANVLKNCVISAGNLALGDFDGTNDLTSTSAVSVRCTNGTPYSVTLSTGASGSYANRTLTNGTDTLVYNLYTDAGHTTIWGDNTGGSGHVVGAGTGFAAATALDVYGRLLASDNTGPVDAGVYTDTIVASIVY
jgi:spore coat protein U-like protein